MPTSLNEIYTLDHDSRQGVRLGFKNKRQTISSMINIRSNYPTWRYKLTNGLDQIAADATKMFELQKWVINQCLTLKIRTNRCKKRAGNIVYISAYLENIMEFL